MDNLIILAISVTALVIAFILIRKGRKWAQRESDIITDLYKDLKHD